MRLLGAVDEAMLRDFNTQLSSARQAGAPIVIELMTSGGDADTARRIALEIQLVQETEHREVYFLGKTLVYSAGMTIMASVPVDRRFAARDTVFLLHERRLTQNVHLPGQRPPICRSSVSCYRNSSAAANSNSRVTQRSSKEVL